VYGEANAVVGLGQGMSNRAKAAGDLAAALARTRTIRNPADTPAARGRIQEAPGEIGRAVRLKRIRPLPKHPSRA
jgi:hypothetical protein